MQKVSFYKVKILKLELYYLKVQTEKVLSEPLSLEMTGQK